jgi:hypothetical protein
MEPDAKEHVLSLLKDAINHYGLGRIETAKLDVQEKFQLTSQQVEQLVTHLNGGQEFDAQPPGHVSKGSRSCGV